MAASIVKVTSSRILLFTNCKISHRLFSNPNIIRTYSSSSENQEELEVVEDESNFLVDEEEDERLRNFSNLPPHLLNREHGRPPKQEELEQLVFRDNKERKEFIRKLYAQYGSESGIDPKICFPSKEELKIMKEYETLYECTFHELVANVNEEKSKELDFRKKLQERVDKNMAKMDSILEAYNKKKQNTIQAEIQAKEKKILLLDQAEEFYGYPVHPNSKEFRSFMDKIHEEEKKAKKERKKKKRESFLGKKLLQEQETKEEKLQQ